MICPKCANEVEENTIICPTCGEFVKVANQHKKCDEAKKEVSLAIKRVFNRPTFLVYAILFTVLCALGVLSCVMGIVSAMNGSLFSGFAIEFAILIFIPVIITTINAWQAFSNKESVNYKNVRGLRAYMTFRKVLSIIYLIFISIFCLMLLVVVFEVVSYISSHFYGGLSNEEFAYVAARELSHGVFGDLGVVNEIKTLFTLGKVGTIIIALLLVAAIITYYVFKIIMYSRSRAYWNVLTSAAQTNQYQASKKYIPTTSLFVWGAIEAVPYLFFIGSNWGFALFGIVSGAILIVQGLIFRAMDNEQLVAKEKIRIEDEQLKKVQKEARDEDYKRKEAIRENEEQERKALAAKREQEEYERAQREAKAKEEQQAKDAQTQQMMQQMMQTMMLNMAKQQQEDLKKSRQDEKTTDDK